MKDLWENVAIFAPLGYGSGVARTAWKEHGSSFLFTMAVGRETS